MRPRRGSRGGAAPARRRRRPSRRGRPGAARRGSGRARLGAVAAGRRSSGRRRRRTVGGRPPAARARRDGLDPVGWSTGGGGATARSARSARRGRRSAVASRPLARRCGASAPARGASRRARRARRLGRGRSACRRAMRWNMPLIGRGTPHSLHGRRLGGEYTRGSGPSRRFPPRPLATRDDPLGHPLGREQRGARAAVDARIRRREVGRERALARRARRTAPQCAPAIPSSASGAIPTGVASTGTSHASASSTASPKPSRSDGTSTALAALTHSGTSSGCTSPSVSSGTSPATAARAVEALLRARRVGGEQQAGRVGVEPEPRARLARAAAGGSAARSTPHGSTATRRRVPAPATRSRASVAETVAARSTNRSAARLSRPLRGCARSVPWNVTTCGAPRSASAGHAVRPKCAWIDVEALAAVAAAQLARGARVGAQAGREREQLDLDAVDAAAAPRPGRCTKRPSAGPCGGRMHVRDDERAHRLRQRTRARVLSQMRLAPAQAAPEDSPAMSNDEKEDGGLPTDGLASTCGWCAAGAASAGRGRSSTSR